MFNKKLNETKNQKFNISYWLYISPTYQERVKTHFDLLNSNFPSGEQSRINVRIPMSNTRIFTTEVIKLYSKAFTHS